MSFERLEHLSYPRRLYDGHTIDSHNIENPLLSIRLRARPDNHLISQALEYPMLVQLGNENRPEVPTPRVLQDVADSGLSCSPTLFTPDL
jgi:hypothetical protein